MKTKSTPKVECVISGVSGRFPSADSMEEFEYKLFNKIDMVTEDDSRWKPGLFNLPRRNGKIKSIDKFDAEFFNTPDFEAEFIDPQDRIFLELVFEAAADAGIQPEELAGERTGMFWGACFQELHRDYEDPFRVPTISRAMASRVTHYFNIRGPTIHTDTACNSSLHALNEAFQSLRNGLVDRAIVAGSNTCFRPMVSQRFRDLKMINKDGTCKCLDQSADGYCRSEAIVVILLERKDIAKRIYAKIRNSKSGSDGYKEEGITFPSMSSQRRLAQETYDEAGIDPAEIGYIEAHVTGTAAGDPVEMTAMHDVICVKKTEPLLVGCLKSSIGHAEGGSGLAGIAKALIVLQNRLIPPNIHFKEANPNIQGLMSGKMVPVTEVTKLPGTLIPVNSFGFGGANTHVVLEGQFEERHPEPVKHRLVLVCGRTMESVNHMLQKLMANKSFRSADFLSLIDTFSKSAKMNFRGHLLLNDIHMIHSATMEVKSKKTCISFSHLPSDFTADASFDELELFSQTREEICSKGRISEAFSFQLTWAILFKKMHLQFDKVIGIGSGKIAADFMNDQLDTDEALSRAMTAGTANGHIVTNSSEDLDDFLVLEVNRNGLKIITDKVHQYELSQLDSSLLALANLYENGMQMSISGIYPSVVYPLPSSTPTLSSLIKWNHNKSYSIAPYLVQGSFLQKNKVVKFHIDRRNVEDAFFYDHRIDERILFPATGYLMCTWIAFAKLSAAGVFEFPVEFCNVSFVRATVLQKGSDTSFSVLINEDSGEFSVSESDSVVVTGTIRKWLGTDFGCTPIVNDPHELKELETTLSLTQIYKEFRVRGYDYGPFFQDLFESDPNGNRGNLIWRDVIPKSVLDGLVLETEDEWDRLWLRSWVSFVDAMFQLDILNSQNDSRSLFVPTRVESIICDPEQLRKNAESSFKFLDSVTMNQSFLVATHRGFGNTIFTKGLLVKGLKTTLLKRRQQQPTLFHYAFRPFFGQSVTSKSVNSLLRQYLKICHAAHQGLQLHHNFDLDDKRFALLKNITHGSHDSLESDLLLGRTECSGEFLFPLLDTSITTHPLPLESENPFDVLEVNSSAQILGKMVKEIWPGVLLHDCMKLNYTVLHPNPDDLPTSLTSDLNIAKGSSPADVKKQHLILYKCFDDDNWAKPHDFRSIISSSFNSLQDGGYLWIIYHEDPCISCSNLSSLIRAYAPERNLIQPEEIRKFGEGIGFRTIRDISLDKNSTLRGLLFRKVTIDHQQLTHRVIEVGVDNYDKWFEDLKLFLREENEYKDKRIWIVPKVQDSKQQATGITGLVKSLRLEEGGDRLRTLIDFSVQKVDISNRKYDEVLRNDMVYNIFDQETQTWGFEQSVFYPTAKDDMPTTLQSESYLRCLKAGDLTSLTWVQDKEHGPAMRKNTLTIDVTCSALNFRDIMFASGQLDSDAIPGIHPSVVQDSILGLEFSGIDQSKRRVMGIIPYRGLATKITTDSDNDFIWPVPDDWSLEQAATVPVVYATAYYALIVRGELGAGDSVLIHSGCGGVGLAALSIATSIGCHVFATCGSAQKREYLLKRYPQLQGRIFNSRDICFEEQILKATAGRGVDAVLNSLAEDKLQASIRCLAISGRFLEIGKVDFVKNHPMFLHQMSDNRSFHGILLDALFHYDQSQPMTQKVCNDKKRVRNLLLQGIQDGVVRPLDATIFPPEDVEHAFRFMASGKHIGKVIVRIRDENNNAAISSIKSTHCHPSKSYIVLGGLGGFGMEVVHFLVSRGATSIMISSRSGIRDAYQRYCVSRLRHQGVGVFICTADITKESGCKQLLEETMQQTKLPIGGIFNIAVVYKDCLYQDQYVSQFREVCAPKAEATMHLDRLSRTMCPELDHFVTFSSISANRGNAGQTNYNFANSLMDSICQERRKVGLPGLSIQWGVVGDVGIVADMSHGNDMVLLGSRAQRMHSSLEVMDMFLQGDSPICLSYIKADPESSKKESSESVNILSVITRLLGMKDMTSMDPETTLGGLGVDSLIAVEIKQALDKGLGSNVSIKEVRNLSIATIIKMSQQQQSSPESPESPSSS